MLLPSSTETTRKPPDTGRTPGGISPFPSDAGRTLADALGVRYDSFGATP